MKKILVLGNYKDVAQYHPLDEVDKRLKEILPDFELHFTDKSSELTKLTEFDGVISYWDDWNTPVPPEETAALVSFVKNGGGLLIIHNGISLALNEDFRDMAGGRFLTHPTQEPITFMPLTTEPVTGCAAFTLMEEPYRFELTEDDKELIMTYSHHGEIYPAGWKKNFGLGKLVYLTPGHTYEKFDVPAYRELIHRCMLYTTL